MVSKPLDTDEALKTAIRYHQSGNLQQAEYVYKSILEAAPDHAEANHLLGVLAYQAGKYDIAVQFIARAITVNGEQATYYNNLGLVLAAQGKPDDAITAYQTAISIKPDYTEALNNLGHALQVTGRLDESINAYRQVIALKPDYAEACNNLGVVLQYQGKYDDAAAAYRQAIEIKPDYAEAYTNWGNVLLAARKYEDALAKFDQAVAIRPGYAGAHNNRGHALQALGNHEAALSAFQQAITINPEYGEAWTNLGNLYLSLGNQEQALAAYDHAIRYNPGNAGAHNNRGSVLIMLGRFDEARKAFQRAITIKPDYADAHNNLGNILENQGRFDEALAEYEQAIAIHPGHADAHNNRGIVLQAQGEHGKALEAYRQALTIEPDFADALNNRGNALQAQGKLDDARAAYLQVLSLRPDDARVHSNLLFCHNYDPGMDAQSLYAAHQEWNTRFAAGLGGSASHLNNPDPDRRLRIGYISPDFYNHPVATFIEPVLARHDRNTYEVVCYSNVNIADAVTRRLQGLADTWHDISGMTDEQVAALIRQDGIDILVDLAGHTGGNRLLVFAQKPAPVQVTYLGYPSTSGLTAMDYRLTDAWMDPPGMTEAFHSETLVRLPAGAVCYKPPDPGPEVKPVPAPAPGHVTFVSFNNAVKVRPEVIALWSSVLQAVPDARLLMKAKQLRDSETLAMIRGMFEENGITPDRLELIYWVPGGDDHLSIYNRTHIALDPFPYNGCTTTCEALWMGVPVITMQGEESRSRMSLSILKQAGLDECIAASPGDYVAIARDLATDIARLNTLRQELRHKIRQSTLVDAAAFTRSVESAYRDIWMRWCKNQVS